MHNKMFSNHKKLKMILCIFLCIAAGCDDPASRDESEALGYISSIPIIAAPQDIPEFVYWCDFFDRQWPENLVVYAVSGFYGMSIIYPIRISDRPTAYEAHERHVYVNMPDAPVALILAAGGPSIWQVHWTSKTKIVAVYIPAIYSSSIVVGLDPETPVLFRGKGNNCPYSDMLQSRPGQYSQVRLNEESKQLFDQPSQAHEMQSETIYLGTLPKGKGEYRQVNPRAAEALRYPGTQLFGQAAIEEALNQGLIRRATVEDIESWIASDQEKLNTLINRLSIEQLPPDWDEYVKHGVLLARLRDPEELAREDVYVVLKPFRIPSGLPARRSMTKFILPQGVPRPTWEESIWAPPWELYDVTHASCTGNSQACE